MDSEETTFEIFLRDRMKEKGVSLKKLSDLTGISINHIENMLRGDFEHIPPTPYFRGYLLRLGEILNFDAEAWWGKIKREEAVRESGPTDALPKNRFARKSPAKTIAISAVILVILVVLGFALPHVLGRPAITITSPQENPYMATSSSVVIQGMVKNANSLYVKEGGETNEEGDEVVIASDGSWQKNVFLQAGVNTFEISAQKFLGGTTDIMEQVIYNPTANVSSTSPSLPSSTINTSSTK